MSVDSHLETTANDINKKPHHTMEHACGRENASDDATESDKELPQRHVLLGDSDH